MPDSPPSQTNPPKLDPAASPAIPTFEPPTEPGFTPYNIFIGSDGLRAGWSILLFLIFFVVFLTIVEVAMMWLPGSQGQLPSLPTGPISWQFAYENEIPTLLSVIAATWLMSKVERRPFSDYGYRSPRGARFFLSGLVWGIALLSLLVYTLHAAGLLVFDTRILFGGSIVRFGLIWLAGFLLVGFFEESFSRGFLQFTLTRGLSGLYRLFAPNRASTLGFWTAATIISVAFGFGHHTNPGESPVGLLSASLAGFVFCLSLRRTGSLWWAIGFHTSWDWAQSFLYGVPDSGLISKGRLFATHPLGKLSLSGGPTGPEGSLLLLPTLAVAALAILVTFPRSQSGYGPASTPPASLH